MSYGDYVEQLTFLLLLKDGGRADETTANHSLTTAFIEHLTSVEGILDEGGALAVAAAGDRLRFGPGGPQKKEGSSC